MDILLTVCVIRVVCKNAREVYVYFCIIIIVISATVFEYYVFEVIFFYSIFRHTICRARNGPRAY